MNRVRISVSILLSFCTVLWSTSSTPGDEPRQPRVLLIGDSISIYYAPFVKELLAGKAQVVHGGHAVDTKFGLEHVDAWLKKGPWDVIHFNWGLHDLKQKGTQVPVEEYEKNLRELVRRMKASGAKLIWATTTPVGKGTDRRQEDVKRYNAAARKVMAENDVPVNDLYAIARPQLTRIQKPDKVHFEDAGSRLFAASVVDGIVAVLQGKKTWTPPTVTFTATLDVRLDERNEVVSATLTDAEGETCRVVLDEMGRKLAADHAGKTVEVTGTVAIPARRREAPDEPAETMWVTVTKYNAPQ